MHIGYIILLFVEVFIASHAGLSDSAEVLEVKVTGSRDDYTFSVTVKSPDTGCEQYANWWEVISPEGDLIYRRILGHSHVNEQPFTRSGGAVRIPADQEVIVRAHMNNKGYGGNVMKGSVTKGFKPFELDRDFAKYLETKEPLPSDCPF